MKPELFWLVLTATFTAVLWIPHVANRFKELGPPSITRWFPPPDPPHRAQWANRNAMAHANAIENLVVFAPLAIVASMVGAIPLAALACKVFFFARVLHAVTQILGFPIPVRTLAFLVGFGCQMVLAVTLIANGLGK